MFQCDGDNHQNNLLIFWFIWNDYCLYGHGILRQKKNFHIFVFKCTIIYFIGVLDKNHDSRIMPPL